MSKTLLVVVGLLVGGCTASIPELRSRDRVRVVSGFYEGCTGEVDSAQFNLRWEYSLTDNVCSDRYTIIRGLFAAAELRKL